MTTPYLCGHSPKHDVVLQCLAFLECLSRKVNRSGCDGVQWLPFLCWHLFIFCQPVWAELVGVIWFRGGSVLTNMSSPTKDAIWELLKRGKKEKKTKKKKKREREREGERGRERGREGEREGEKGFVYKWCERLWWEVLGTFVKEEKKLQLQKGDMWSCCLPEYWCWHE